MLHGKANDIAHESFKSYIAEGNKMNYKQLRKMNSVWKKDYVKELFKESKIVEELVKKNIDICIEQGDENNKVIENIEDM